MHVLRVRAEDRFSRDFASAVNRGEPTVRLRDVAAPEWHRVYIFGPYTHPDRISSVLGFPWRDSKVEALHHSDSANLLVYVRDRRVVLSVLHSRSDGDFVPDGVGRDYSPEDAEFSIVPGDTDGRLLLKPIPKQQP